MVETARLLPTQKTSARIGRKRSNIPACAVCTGRERHFAIVTGLRVGGETETSHPFLVENTSRISSYLLKFVTAGLPTRWMDKTSARLENGSLRTRARERTLTNVRLRKNGFYWWLFWGCDVSFVSQAICISRWTLEAVERMREIY